MQSKTKITLMGILAGVGVLTTTGLAIRSGDRLSNIYEMYIAEKNYSDRSTSEINKEYAAKVVKELGPVILSAGATIGVIVGLCKHSIKTEAGLIASLYFAREQLERVKELGSEHVDEVRLEDVDVDFLDVPKDRVLVYEPYSDQLLVTSESEIERAENKANRKLQNHYVVRLSSILKDLKAYIPNESYNIGWEMGNTTQMEYWKLAKAPYISLKLEKAKEPIQREIYILRYEVPPGLLEQL